MSSVATHTLPWGSNVMLYTLLPFMAAQLFTLKSSSKALAGSKAKSPSMAATHTCPRLSALMR